MLWWDQRSEEAHALPLMLLSKNVRLSSYFEIAGIANSFYDSQHNIDLKEK
jgi:hypothetical protein